MIKAKAKAIELVKRFRMYDIQICDLMGSELKGYEEEHYKQCALICVDEILDAVTTIADKKYDFYTEVKKEIEKL